jgi:hypothetical protein
MKPAARFAILAAVVAVAVVLFIVLKPSDDDKSTSSSSNSQQPGTHTTSADGTRSPNEPPPSPPVANIKVGKDGKPVGGVQDLEFGKDQQVQFVVSSQVADEVHVHGYDIMKDVEPGKPVKFSFKGDIDGDFEVELEDRGEQIIDLKVTP